MPINYEVAINKLTTPASYAARVRPQNTVTLNNLASDISHYCTVTPPDVQAVLMAFVERVQTELSRGNQVNINGLGIFSTSVCAKLPTLTDPLPSDAKIMVKVRADGTITRNVRRMAGLSRIESPSRAPSIATVAALTGTLQGTLAVGTVVELLGERLAFALSKPDEGVYLVSTSVGPTVRMMDYLSIGDKRLVFALPAGLPANMDFRIEVRARRRGSIALRTGLWATPVGPTAPVG